MRYYNENDVNSEKKTKIVEIRRKFISIKH